MRGILWVLWVSRVSGFCILPSWIKIFRFRDIFTSFLKLTYQQINILGFISSYTYISINRKRRRERKSIVVDQLISIHFIFILSLVFNIEIHFITFQKVQMDDLKSIRNLCRVCLGRPENCEMLFLNATLMEKIIYIGGSAEVMIKGFRIFCKNQF